MDAIVVSRMQRVRRTLLAILFLLILQFLLGMGLNLFTTITRHHPGANPRGYFSGSVQSVVWAMTQGPVLLILHVILGLLLFLISIAVLIDAFRLPGWTRRLLAGLGTVGIMGAGFNGASFLDFNLDLSSFIMSIGFALTTIAYLCLLYIVST